MLDKAVTLHNRFETLGSNDSAHTLDGVSSVSQSPDLTYKAACKLFQNKVRLQWFYLREINNICDNLDSPSTLALVLLHSSQNSPPHLQASQQYNSNDYVMIVDCNLLPITHIKNMIGGRKHKHITELG